jgi:hypothetical protein
MHFVVAERRPVEPVFEQAGMAYGPHPEPGSEASKEAAWKRKNDVGTGPVGQWTKVPDKKKVAALKASVTSKNASDASSMAASAPAKAMQKVGAPPKAATQKATAVKTIPDAAQVVPKAEVLRISIGVKRPVSAEPSSVQSKKQAKVTKAPSSTPASACKAAAPS